MGQRLGGFTCQTQNKVRIWGATGYEHNNKHCQKSSLEISQPVEVQVEAQADSGTTASIISLDLGMKMKMIIFYKGDATLVAESNMHMDMSGRGEIMVQEELA